MIKQAISLGAIRRVVQNTILKARRAGRGLLPEEQRSISSLAARVMNRDVGSQLRGHVPEETRNLMSYFGQNANPRAEEAFVRSITGQRLSPEHAPFLASAGEDASRSMKLRPREERWDIRPAGEGRQGVSMSRPGEHAPKFEVETQPSGVSHMTRMRNMTPQMYEQHGGGIADMMTRFTPVEEALGRVTARTPGAGAQPIRLISMNDSGSSTAGYFMVQGMLDALDMLRESKGYSRISSIYDAVAGKGATANSVDRLTSTLKTIVEPGRWTGTPEDYSKLMHKASKAISGFSGYPVELIPGGPENVRRHMSWLKQSDKGWASGKKTILNETDLFKDVPEDWKAVMDDPFWASRRELLPDINLYGDRAGAGIVSSRKLKDMAPGEFYDVNKINEYDMMNKYSPGVMGHTRGIHHDFAPGDMGDSKRVGTMLSMSPEARKMLDGTKRLVLKRLGGAGSHPELREPDSLASTHTLLDPKGGLEPYTAMMQEAVERGAPIKPGQLGWWDSLKFSPQSYRQGFMESIGPEYRVNMTRGNVDRILPIMTRSTARLPGLLGRAMGEYVPEHGTLVSQITQSLKDMPRAYREAPLAFDATLDPAGKLKLFETNIHGFSGRDLLSLQTNPVDLLRLLGNTGYQQRGSVPYWLGKSPYVAGGLGVPLSASLLGHHTPSHTVSA